MQKSTFSEILGNIGASAKNLVADEAQLFKAEVKANLLDIGIDLRNTIFFSALAAVAVLPFVLFLVIGLGVLLEERYWLSSLIVAAVWGAGMGYTAYVYFLKLAHKNPALAKTEEKIDESAAVVKQKLNEVKDAIEH